MAKKQRLTFLRWLRPRTRKPKVYRYNGLAGCVIQSVSRETGKLVGLYHSVQSGMEGDPELPWTTVCEEHNTLVSHPSLQAAKNSLPFPTSWCDDCRQKEKEMTSTAHTYSIVTHPSEPWHRTECTCGWKGVWLSDPKNCHPCPRATPDKEPVDTHAGERDSIAMSEDEQIRKERRSW